MQACEGFIHSADIHQAPTGQALTIYGGHDGELAPVISKLSEVPETDRGINTWCC